jgi:CHASE2 domain-containing sensor protein
MSSPMDTFKRYFNIFSFPREKRNQFLFNLLLGFIGLVISVALENTNWGQHGINSWFDTFIAQKAKFQGRLATKPGLIILEIDDKGWLDLGKPDQVPRDKLAAMIDTARQGGAKLIVLDFNLSEADYTPPKLLPGKVRL